MKNSDYWRERFTQLEAAQNRKGADAYLEIEKIYRQAQKEIEGKINTWYQRLADNNGISMAEARKMLTRAELKEFKWDVKDYIRYGKENAVNRQWMRQLENASAKYHISRLEALRMHTQHSLEVMYEKELGIVSGTMTDIFESGYYHTVFELQKGFGTGWDIAGLDQNHIEMLLSKPWAADGKNFSERIWGNKQRLISEMHSALTRNVMLGQDPQKAINVIAKKMNTSKNNAGRLVMTEEAYFSSQAQKVCFNDLDVEKYEIVATLDSHTSEICRSMDGHVFQMKDFEPGVTAPPFHVYCRSTTVPYFDDTPGLTGERAARDRKTGRTCYVPGDMNYREWEEIFVNGGDRSGLRETDPDDTIEEGKDAKQAPQKLRAENFPSSFKSERELKNTQALAEYVNGLEGADANVIALFNCMGKLENIESNGIPFRISHSGKPAVSITSYIPTGDMAEVKLIIPELHGDNPAGQVNIILHEEMHMMDLYGRQDPQKSGNWFSTCRKPLADAFINISDSIGDAVAGVFREHDTEYVRIRSEVSAKYRKMISDLNDSVMNHKFKGNYNHEYSKIKKSERTELDYRARNIMGGGVGNLQDIYDALSGGRFRDDGKLIYGHGSSYYSCMESRVHETIANYAALSVTRPDLIDLLRADKPELAAELNAAIMELLKEAQNGG